MSKLKYTIPGEIEYIQFTLNNLQSIHYFISRATNIHSYTVYPTFPELDIECDSNTSIDITTKSDGIITLKNGDYLCYENNDSILKPINSDKIEAFKKFSIQK